MKKYLLLALVTTLTLTACGGTGSTTSTTPIDPTPPITDPIWGALQPSTITPTQLRACPLADTLENGIVSSDVLECTKGTFNGITAAGSTKQCSLTLDGKGTMTFTHSDLSQAITVKHLTDVYFRHKIYDGQHTISMTFEDNKYAENDWLRVSFMYDDLFTLPMANVYMSIRYDNQEASCYSHI